MVSSKIAVYGGSARLAEPERHIAVADENAMLAKLKIVIPLSEEEKREPVEEPKVGQALKARLDRIKREFYATS